MKKLTLVAVMAVALGWSCSERDAGPAPDPITSVVEVSLNSPSGAGSKAFGETSATETWEKAADNIAMFVYKTGETTCAYQRQFTAKELEKCKAVFAIPNVTPDVNYDFYAVANCDFTAEMGTYVPTDPGTTGISKTVLLAKIEGTANPASPYGNLSSYNGSFGDVSTKALRDVNNSTTPHNKGFVMTGLKTEKTPKAEANTPTRVTVDLRRTVAKVAVVAATTQAFHDKYGKDGSTLRILSAKLTKLAEKTTIIAPASYTLPALGTATHLTQDPNVIAAGGIGTFAQYQNLFYIFENGGTAAVDPTVKPVLELTALFDFDGDESDISKDDQTTITYKIALAGDAGSPDMSQPLPADFGLFKRNGYYKVVININGLTENEVVASINILDWETLKTQNVNIGDNS